MITRLVIVAAVAALSLAFAVWWRRREGRFVEADGRMDRADLGFGWRDKPSAVIVDWFGVNCAPCKTVDERIDKITGEIPDLRVVKVDAGERLELAERYNVRRVPTLFVLDDSLKIIWRASGVPTEDAIRSALLGPDWAGRPHPEDTPVAENRTSH